MASNKTVVKGLRASREFFDKCDLVAKSEGVDRNKLIIRVVSEYCASFERKQKQFKPCTLFFKDEDGKWVELCNKDIQNAQENANKLIKSQDGKYDLLFRAKENENGNT